MHVFAIVKTDFLAKGVMMAQWPLNTPLILYLLFVLYFWRSGVFHVELFSYFQIFRRNAQNRSGLHVVLLTIITTQ